MWWWGDASSYILSIIYYTILHRFVTSADQQCDGEEMPRAWDSISWSPLLHHKIAVQWDTPELCSAQYVTTVWGKTICYHTILLNSTKLYSIAVQCALGPVGRNPSFVGPTLVATWHLPIIIILFFRVLPESSSLSLPVSSIKYQYDGHITFENLDFWDQNFHNLLWTKEVSFDL